MAKHQLTYDIFAKALDEHPSWEEFLDDRGKGTTPPEFDAMIEKVFRQVAMDDNVSLGSKTLATRETWVDPNLEWRKREVSCVRTGDLCYRTGVWLRRTGPNVVPCGGYSAPYGCLCASVRELETSAREVFYLIQTLLLGDAVVRVFRVKISRKAKLQSLGQMFLGRLLVATRLVQNVLRSTRPAERHLWGSFARSRVVEQLWSGSGRRHRIPAPTQRPNKCDGLHQQRGGDGAEGMGLR